MKRISCAAAALAATFTAAKAEAHFTLTFPPPWIIEGNLGDPQKDEPCGGEGSPMMSGIVTTFQPGETITVEWTETIYHPGHWRIAFAENRADFVDPLYTLDGNQYSVSFEIENPVMPPVLLDGLFPRTVINGPTETFSQDVTLPNVPCAHCTLQVLQMMVGHGPPNYIYHHCADIELAMPPPPPDAGLPIDDAGLPIDDAGMVIAPDAMETFPDANDMDAGEEQDTGMVIIAPDAMTVPADAGANGGDAAANGDATANGDGGPALFHDNTRIQGTCSCNTTEERARSPLLLLLIIASMSVRRYCRASSRRRHTDRHAACTSRSSGPCT